MTAPLRMPVSVASRKGISAVAATAEERRVVLTSLGRDVAVVDSAARLDDDVRRLREAARVVVDAFSDDAAEKTTRLDLEAVCARLGLDEQAVRARAVQHDANG